MKKEKSLIKNSIFNLVQSCMSILFPLITFTYASRILGTVNLGKVTYINSIVSYFALIASLGISLYATREGGKYFNDKKELSTFFSEIITINIFFTILSYGLLTIFYIFFSGNKLLLLVCSSIIILNTLKIEWLYQIEEEYRYISIRTIFFQIIALIMLFILVTDKDDYIWYAFILVFASGGSAIINFIYSRKFVHYSKVRIHELIKHIKPIFTIFFVTLASSIYLNLDNVMLGMMKGDYSVGIYTVAVKVNTLVRTLLTSINVVIMSRISRILSDDQKEESYTDIFKKGLTAILFLSIPSAIGIFSLSTNIILLFAGKEYVAGKLAMKILSINIIFASIDGYLYYQYFLIKKKEQQAAIITIIGALINLITNLLLINKYSYNGAAFTTLISEVIVFILMSILAKEYIDIRYYLHNILQMLVASMPIIIWNRIISHTIDGVLIGIGITIILSSISYIIFLFILDNQFIKSIFNILGKKVRNKKTKYNKYSRLQ